MFEGSKKYAHITLAILDFGIQYRSRLIAFEEFGARSEGNLEMFRPIPRTNKS